MLGVGSAFLSTSPLSQNDDDSNDLDLNANKKRAATAERYPIDVRSMSPPGPSRRFAANAAIRPESGGADMPRTFLQPTRLKLAPLDAQIEGRLTCGENVS